MSRAGGSGAVDPRTMLPLVFVPPRLLPAFSAVQNCIVHWIGIVRKVASVTFKEQEKVAMIGDAAVYVCDTDAAIRRCIAIADLQDVVVKDDDDSIGFRPQGKGDFDVLVRFGKDFDAVLAMLRKIYWTHMGRELVVVRLNAIDLLHPHLQLQKPSGWRLKIEPLRPRKYLDKLVADQDVAAQRHVDDVHGEFVRLKNELRHALETARDQQYDRMTRQTAQYVQQLAERDAEISSLRDVLEAVRPHVLDSQLSRAIEHRLARIHPTFLAPSSEAKTQNQSGGGGGKDCANCAQLKRLLEQHPTTDKRRIIAAEEALAVSTKELAALRRQMTPERDEIKLLRGAITQADAVLREQRVSLSERVRQTMQLLTPYAVSISKKKDLDGGDDKKEDGIDAAPRMNVPPSTDVATLSSELLTLRGVLRDASALHMAELERLRAEFDAYDTAMVVAVRNALEGMNVAVGTPGGPRLAAQQLVEQQRSLAIAQAQGNVTGERSSQSPSGSPLRSTMSTGRAASPFALATQQQQQQGSRRRLSPEHREMLATGSASAIYGTQQQQRHRPTARYQQPFAQPQPQQRQVIQATPSRTLRVEDNSSKNPAVFGSPLAAAAAMRAPRQQQQDEVFDYGRFHGHADL